MYYIKTIFQIVIYPIKITIKYLIFPLFVLAIIVGLGLLMYGVYSTVALETNKDLYIVGGWLTGVGLISSLVISAVFKDKSTSVVDYMFRLIRELLWSIL